MTDTTVGHTALPKRLAEGRYPTEIMDADTGFEVLNADGVHLHIDYDANVPGAHWATTDGAAIDRAEEDEEAIAAETIRRWNLHEELVEALRAAQGLILGNLSVARRYQMDGPDSYSFDGENAVNIRAQIAAALARAEEGDTRG